jgi:ABC-type phosphate transport system substrate-binding protein
MLTTLPLLALAALLQAGSPPTQPASDFRVIAHPGVKGGKVPLQTLADIFLKHTVRWADGVPIEPVERSMTSPLRASFSRRVLGRSMAEMQGYWGKAMREGIRPPVAKGSDDDVIAYVSSTAGAIGYVAADRELPSTVKPIEIQ